MSASPEKLEVELYRDKGATSRCIDACINESGQFVIETQDIGEAPERFLGDSDYEFWTVVMPQHKARLVEALTRDAFAGTDCAASAAGFFAQIGLVNPDEDRQLLALIQRKYQGNFRARDDFDDFCKEHGIPREGGSWT